MELKYVQKRMLLDVMFSHMNSPRILKSAYGEIRFNHFSSGRMNLTRSVPVKFSDWKFCVFFSSPAYLLYAIPIPIINSILYAIHRDVYCEWGKLWHFYYVQGNCSGFQILCLYVVVPSVSHYVTPTVVWYKQGGNEAAVHGSRYCLLPRSMTLTFIVV